MADNSKRASVAETAREAMAKNDAGAQKKQLVLWFSALIAGGILGWLQIASLNGLFDFIATVFTRLFQFIAVPTIALAETSV